MPAQPMEKIVLCAMKIFDRFLKSFDNFSHGLDRLSRMEILDTVNKSETKTTKKPTRPKTKEKAAIKFPDVVRSAARVPHATGRKQPFLFASRKTSSD